MKPLIIAISIFFITSQLSAQSESAIVGKWKIVTVDVGVYYNYKNDSTFVPEELQESLKGSKDSLLTIALITGMISEFKDYYYIFQTDGQFQETKKGKLKQEGTYIVNKEQQLVTLLVKGKFGNESKQNLNYNIVDSVLEFKIPSDEMTMVFTLEKEQ